MFDEINKDNNLNKDDKKLLAKYLKYDLDNAKNISNAKFAAHGAGIIITDSKYDTEINVCNVQKVRNKCFASTSNKQCNIHGSFTWSDTVGGFVSNPKEVGVFTINSKDSPFFKVWNILVSESESFQSETKSSLNELFGQDTDNDIDNEIDDEINNEQPHKNRKRKLEDITIDIDNDIDDVDDVDNEIPLKRMKLSNSNANINTDNKSQNEVNELQKRRLSLSMIINQLNHAQLDSLFGGDVSILENENEKI
eukprot:202212_1